MKNYAPTTMHVVYDPLYLSSCPRRRLLGIVKRGAGAFSYVIHPYPAALAAQFPLDVVKVRNTGFEQVILNPENYWTLGETEKERARRFLPDYVPGRSLYDYCRNALIEIVELSRVAECIYHHRHSVFYKAWVPEIVLPVSDNFSRAFHSASFDHYGVLDSTNGLFVEDLAPRGSNRRFEMRFDGEKFVPVKHGDAFTAAGRFVLVSDATELMQDSRLYNALVAVPTNGLRVCSATLVQGVPGCGKSEHIIKNSTSQDLVLTSTRDAAADMRRRLANVGRGKTVVKTVDSCIINMRKKYKIVWVDEARMCHAGKMVAIMHIVDAERLYLLGDVAQIPYICRVPQVTPQFHLVENLVAKDSIEYKSISYRIPVSIAARISPFYPHGG